MAHLPTTDWQPESKQQKDAVRDQLQRLFTHHSFKNSKRYAPLLRYIVEHHLQDGHDHLKERVLGMEVFSRPADYDTNADPVVRIAASEIRRRIAQYYHEPGHEDEIRIELPVGSYVPEFHLPAPTASPRMREASPASLPDLISRRASAGNRWRLYAISTCFLVILIGLGAWYHQRKAAPPKPASPVSVSALDQFWSPVLASSNPVILCVGTRPGSSNVSQVSFRPPAQASSMAWAEVAWPDAKASSTIGAFLGRSGKVYQAEDSAVVTMTSLTQSPVVLVAGANNAWTLRMTDRLRFHFVMARKTFGIADRKNPSKKWSLLPGTTEGSSQDYAIIGRFSDSTTGQVSVVAAGIGAAGTLAAADFVTSARCMNKLVKRLPKGWQSKNIEALLSVYAVGNQAGAPHIEAVEVW